MKKNMPVLGGIHHTLNGMSPATDEVLMTAKPATGLQQHQPQPQRCKIALRCFGGQASHEAAAASAAASTLQNCPPLLG